MSVLPPREAYRRWAPTYARETAITVLEDALVAAMTPPLAGKRLLDAGCGTGRRLRGTGAALAVGVEPCAEMLAAGSRDGSWPPEVRLLEGDVRALPVAAQDFDVVWCRLVLGHVAEPGHAYAELARATAPGGLVIVTDFHADAHAAGHRRTFRDAEGVHEIEHHVHDALAHISATLAAGLTPVEMRTGAVGPEICGFYAAAGRLADYEADLGLPLVLALAFRKRG